MTVSSCLCRAPSMATSLSANIDDEMLYDYGGATVPSLLQHAGFNTAARPPPPPGTRLSQVRQKLSGDALAIHQRGPMTGQRVPQLQHAASRFSSVIRACTACLSR